MATIEANSLEEAVERAERFKAEGRYDWFRGQNVELIPTPTMGRLSKGELENAKLRIDRFFSWLIQTPGLEDLKNNPDAIWAIAQHYGIPTYFLDFSTEPGVAGYFAATQGKILKAVRRSCIYCLNTQELRRCWSDVRQILQHYPDIDFVTPKIPNLWRLEAQRGVFLYCPKNWQTVYVMDRILFPPSGVPSFPTQADIYPERKSQLELLLDHYFEVEPYFDIREKVKAVFPEAMVLELEAPPEGFEAEFFVNGKLPLRRDWGRKALTGWLAITAELLQTTALGEIGLRVSLRTDPHELQQRVSFGIRRALQLDPQLRMKAIRWFLLPQKRLQRRLAQALDRLWNGLRLLPYSNDEIADAIGFCFALHRLGFHEAEREEEQLKIVERCLGPSICVEFSSWDGSGVRAFTSRDDLLKAVRPDIERYLRLRHRRYATHISPLLQLCSNPRRLFVFRSFARVFATQICPTQVMRNNRIASHFSVARLEGFGLP